MQTHENVLCSTDGKLNASKINQQNTSLNTIEVPGQPVTNEQLYAAILLSEEPDYYDPATYEGAEWPPYLQSTLFKGLPAHGNVFFNTGFAYCLWCLCFLGFAGLQRWYVGQNGCAFLCFFTWGCCGLGSLLDFCLIPSFVKDANYDVKEIAKICQERRRKLFAKQQLSLSLIQPTEDSVQPSETLPYVQQSDNISSQALAYRAAPLESVGDASVSVSVQEGCKESNFTPPVGSFSADVSKADNESNYPFNASTKD